MSYLRKDRHRAWGVEPRPFEALNEYVPRTESEEARRRNRDFLRERDESDVPDWDDELGE